jgi:Fe2+ transport system protein FeoA
MTTKSPAEKSQPRTLADLQPGESGIVGTLHVEGSQRRRLMDLGFVPGSVVKAELRAPLGDPIAYLVRGALIALRADQAALVTLKEERKEQHP